MAAGPGGWLVSRPGCRAGLIAGWLAGMVTSVWMLYVTSNQAAGQAHWGGSAFALSHLG